MALTQRIKIGHFTKQWNNSDAILIVEGQKLHVHTVILTFASPVFEKMFNSGFREATTKEVNLKGKTYDIVERMLEIIYPNVNCNLSLAKLEDLKALMELSKEYMIESIKGIVELKTVILCKEMMFIDCIEYQDHHIELFTFADSAGFREAIEICVDVFGERASYPHTKKLTEEKLSKRTKVKLMAKIMKTELNKLERRSIGKDNPSVMRDLKYIAKCLSEM